MNRPLVAVSIAADSVEEMLSRIPLAESMGDWIEFRLDSLADFCYQDPLRQVGRLVRSTSRPVILTHHMRRASGDPLPVTEPDQIDFWSSLFTISTPSLVYFDLDFQLVVRFQESGVTVPWDRVIASHHDFHETPASLPDLYDRMKATPAGILKIATQAKDISDNVTVYHLHEQARLDDRSLIGLAMGPAGVMSRILSPAWGGTLTFGSLSPGMETAPGQPTARQLRDLYRLQTLTQQTSITGIIGDPVQHSLSPFLHNESFKHIGLDWVYLPLLVTDLGRYMEDFVLPSTRQVKWDLQGLSVTIPHKVGVMKYLDTMDEMAAEVGSVNTLIMDGMKVHGANTDVEGAMAPLRRRLKLKGARVVVLGAGGAARAVVYGLVNEGARVAVLSRDIDKARALTDRIGGESGPILDLASYDYEVLINSTPVGMHDPEDSPVHSHLLKPGKIIFDLVARRGKTRLVREAGQAGCLVINGVEMLVHQAAAQFELWTQQKAPIDIMFRAASEA